MAGVSTKEIKTRIRSMESTRQITRAMEMVASEDRIFFMCVVIDSKVVLIIANVIIKVECSRRITCFLVSINS